MKINNLKFTVLSIGLFLFAASHAGDISSINVKSIPAASFKSQSADTVDEINGCYSNAVFSGFTLPIGTAFIGAKLTAVDSEGTEQARLVIAKSNSAMFDGNQLDSIVELQALNVIKYIPTNYPYIVKENDFFKMHFIKNKSNTVRLCGVKIFYLSESELIFYNGFN